MIYTKLPVVLLSTLASKDDNSTNCQIATYILNNVDKVKMMTIVEIATSCHVANSSISRFCKEIGLNDFNELKEMLSSNEFNFEQFNKGTTLDERNELYANEINKSINMAVSSLDSKQIIKLCHDINKYHNVYAFGLLKGECAAITLQVDLLMQKKYIETKISYDQQLEVLKNCTKDDLIIIFSYTGCYFDYSFRKLPDSLIDAKVYLITSSNDTKKSNYYNEIITFQSKQDQLSHPYQLMCISSIIAQNYAIIKKID